MSHILAIDQGTTSSRAIIFSSELLPVASAQKEFPQFFPNAGWVEHNVEEIWSGVVDIVQQALQKAKLNAKEIAAIEEQAAEEGAQNEPDYDDSGPDPEPDW